MRPVNPKYLESLKLEADGSKEIPTVVGPTEFILESIHLNLFNLTLCQLFYRDEEASDRHFAAKLNHRVTYLSLAQFFAIIGVSFAQIVAVKRIFYKKQQYSARFESKTIHQQPVTNESRINLKY